MAKDHERATEPGRAGRDAAVADSAEPARVATSAQRPLDAAARARIGRGLRLHYAAVLALPVPERLTALLDALAARTDSEAPR